MQRLASNPIEVQLSGQMFSNQGVSQRDESPLSVSDVSANKKNRLQVSNSATLLALAQTDKKADEDLP